MSTPYVFFAYSSVILLVALLGPLVLRKTPRGTYWRLGAFLSVLLAAPFWTAPFWAAGGDLGPPHNPPVALAAFFVVLPTLATFATERGCLSALANARPLTSAIVALPIGAVTYVSAILIGITVAVNVGALTP